MIYNRVLLELQEELEYKEKVEHRLIISDIILQQKLQWLNLS